MTPAELQKDMNDGNDSNENRATVELSERVRQLLPRLDAATDSAVSIVCGNRKVNTNPLPKEAAALLRECLEVMDA